MAAQGKAPTPYRVRRSPGDIIFGAVVDFFDFFFKPLQRLLGARSMPYVFVLPNLLVFGIFILWPMLLNFYYAMTGSSQLLPENRPWVGLDNFGLLFDCGNFLDPNSCRQDLFWKAAFNTGWFVSIQVGALILISLLIALAIAWEMASANSTASSA